MPDIDSTRKQILNSAYEQFVENGFRGSTMRGIAENAGIKAASIYNHFTDKEDIFAEVFKVKHPLFRLLSVLDDARGDTVEELLTSAIENLNNELSNDPKLLNLFFVEFVEMEGKHIAAAIETNFPHDSPFIRKIFQRKSEIRDVREPVLVRSLIGTALANVVFSWFIGDSKPKRWGSHAEMTDVLLRGLIGNT